MLMAVCGMGQAQKYFDKAKVSSHQDSVSYAVGLLLADNLYESELGKLDVTPEMIGKAFKDVKSDQTAFDKERAVEILLAESEKLTAQKKAEADAKEREFLANNAKEPGVKTTESGLQYLVIREGNGKKPTMDNSVKIHYEGKLINGDVFDTSYDGGEPTTLDVDGVIEGLSEGLQLMSEGAEYIFYIPYDLGYGSYSPGDILPAYSTLIFSVELISVEEKSDYDDDDDMDESEGLFDEE